MVVVLHSASVASVHVPSPANELWCVHPVLCEPEVKDIQMPSGLSLTTSKSAMLWLIRSSPVVWKRVVVAPKTRYFWSTFGAQLLNGDGF
eukprot:2374565-Heterocapsa_arctica.AAC.1